jgi:hypothetical membrane protein
LSTKTKRKGRPVRPRYLAVAGALLFLVALVGFMGIITAEALYPGPYTTSGNEISDLGATQPPHSIIRQPSATIFNTAMMVCGALTLVAAFCIQRGFKRLAAPMFIGLFGLGALGVGVFPGDHGTLHLMFALLTFAAGAIAAIVCLTIETGPFRYFSVLLGTVSLVVLLLELFLQDHNPLEAMGNGGIERWIAYPVLLWIAGLGGHLMGRAR